MIRLPPLRCTFATQISLKLSTLDILSSECYDSLQCRRNNKSCETSFGSISHRSQQTGGAIYGYVYNQPQHGTAVQTASAAGTSQKLKPRPSSGILARSYAAKHGQRKPVKILDEEYVNSSSIYSQKLLACICKKCDELLNIKSRIPLSPRKRDSQFTKVLRSFFCRYHTQQIKCF
jgi:hypothetical protein